MVANIVFELPAQPARKEMLYQRFIVRNNPSCSEEPMVLSMSSKTAILWTDKLGWTYNPSSSFSDGSVHAAWSIVIRTINRPGLARASEPSECSYRMAVITRESFRCRMGLDTILCFHLNSQVFRLNRFNWSKIPYVPYVPRFHSKVQRAVHWHFVISSSTPP